MKRIFHALMACAFIVGIAHASYFPDVDYCADLSGEWYEPIPGGPSWNVTQDASGNLTGSLSDPGCPNATIQTGSKKAGAMTYNGGQYMSWNVTAKGTANGQACYVTELVAIKKGEVGCAKASIWEQPNAPPALPTTIWSSAGSGGSQYCNLPNGEDSLNAEKSVTAQGWEPTTENSPCGDDPTNPAEQCGLQHYQVALNSPPPPLPSTYNWGGRQITFVYGSQISNCPVVATMWQQGYPGPVNIQDSPSNPNVFDDWVGTWTPTLATGVNTTRGGVLPGTICVNQIPKYEYMDCPNAYETGTNVPVEIQSTTDYFTGTT